MPSRAVFLVGFMASGKSSVGHELARRLGWDFANLDSLIESRENRSIAAIFSQQGEDYFRQVENAALRDLISSLARSTIVSLGGGAFIQQSNRDLLREWPTVFLHAPVEELWRRCCSDAAERPLRKDHEQFVQLYQERLPIYRQATATIE